MLKTQLLLQRNASVIPLINGSLNLQLTEHVFACKLLAIGGLLMSEEHLAHVLLIPNTEKMFQVLVNAFLIPQMVIQMEHVLLIQVIILMQPKGELNVLVVITTILLSMELPSLVTFAQE